MIGRYKNFVSFFNNLDQFLLIRVDILIWRASKDKNFFLVKNCFSVLIKTCRWDNSWPWRMIWKTKAPVKVACFGGVATWGYT